jgi:hypothetical protein
LLDLLSLLVASSIAVSTTPQEGVKVAVPILPEGHRNAFLDLTSSNEILLCNWNLGFEGLDSLGSEELDKAVFGRLRMFPSLFL